MKTRVSRRCETCANIGTEASIITSVETALFPNLFWCVLTADPTIHVKELHEVSIKCRLNCLKRSHDALKL